MNRNDDGGSIIQTLNREKPISVVPFKPGKSPRPRGDDVDGLGQRGF